MNPIKPQHSCHSQITVPFMGNPHLSANQIWHKFPMLIPTSPPLDPIRVASFLRTLGLSQLLLFSAVYNVSVLMCLVPCSIGTAEWFVMMFSCNMFRNFLLVVDSSCIYADIFLGSDFAYECCLLLW